MSIGMEVGVFLAYAAGMLVVYIFGRALLVPLKWMMKLLCNSVIGGAAVIALNLVGEIWGIFVPLNVFTAVVAGVLGIPGIIILIMILK